VIASHFVEPIERRIGEAAVLRADPAVDSQALAELSPGDGFRMLDDSVGWAWGYAGEDGRVGYVRSEALS
jgi:hypothetical protein